MVTIVLILVEIFIFYKNKSFFFFFFFENFWNKPAVVAQTEPVALVEHVVVVVAFLFPFQVVLVVAFPCPCATLRCQTYLFGQTLHKYFDSAGAKYSIITKTHEDQTR